MVLEYLRAILPRSIAEVFPNSTMLLKGALQQLAISAMVFPFMTVAQPANCPDYTTFSSSPQGNPSAGPLRLPFMRPASECRTFTSSAVEVRSSCHSLYQCSSKTAIPLESYQRHEGENQGL